jgi:hypothetical protein
MNYRWSCQAVSGHFCFCMFFVVTERGCRWTGIFFSVSALIPILHMFLNFTAASEPRRIKPDTANNQYRRNNPAFGASV